MAPVENFASGPEPSICFALTTANTNRDGTGAITTALQVGTNPCNDKGFCLMRVNAKANGTLSADCQVVIYKWNGAWVAIAEVKIPAATPGVSAPSGEGERIFANLQQGIPGRIFPPGTRLGLSATVMPTGPSTPAIHVDLDVANY